MTCTYTDKIRNHRWKTIYMYEGKYTQQPGHRLMCTSCQEVVRETHEEEQQPTRKRTDAERVEKRLRG